MLVIVNKRAKILPLYLGMLMTDCNGLKNNLLTARQYF